MLLVGELSADLGPLIFFQKFSLSSARSAAQNLAKLYNI